MFARSDFQIAAGYTQQSHYDAIKAALIAAGWGNPIDEYTVTTVKHMVFKPLSSGAFAARMHLHLALSSTNTLTMTVADGWNAGTHSSTKETGNTVSTGALNTTSSPINYTILTGPNGFYILGRQGSTVGMCGAVLMDVVFPDWDTASHLPWLLHNIGTNAAYTFSGSGKNPWNSSIAAVYQFVTFNSNTMSDVEPLSNTRQIYAGQPIFNAYGVLGYLPDDVGRVTATGAMSMDTHTVDGTEVWFQPLTDANQAAVLRIN